MPAEWWAGALLVGLCVWGTVLFASQALTRGDPVRLLSALTALILLVTAVAWGGILGQRFQLSPVVGRSIFALAVLALIAQRLAHGGRNDAQ